MRANNEVIFKLLLIPVVDEIDSWVNVFIADLAESWKVCLPFFRHISQQVVNLAGQLISSLDLSVTVRALKNHCQPRLLARRLHRLRLTERSVIIARCGKREHCTGRGEVQTITVAA